MPHGHPVRFYLSASSFLNRLKIVSAHSMKSTPACADVVRTPSSDVALTRVEIGMTVSKLPGYRLKAIRMLDIALFDDLIGACKQCWRYS